MQLVGGTGGTWLCMQLDTLRQWWSSCSISQGLGPVPNSHCRSSSSFKMCNLVLNSRALLKRRIPSRSKHKNEKMHTHTR